MTLLYCEHSPPSVLIPRVECFWSLESAVPVTQHRVPPDGCLDIVYTRGQGLRAVGAMTVEQRFSFAAGACTVGVRFQPGMAGPFLRLPAAELTDGIAPLSDAWGRRAAALERQLDDAESGADRLRILRAAVAPPAEALNPVQRALAAITAAQGAADVAWIAARANLSPRQFRRRCLEESGLTPKLLCRVLRFRQACRLAASAPQPDWVSIALETGYFDQAHLIRDFREFTGRTPMAVFSNTGVATVG